MKIVEINSMNFGSTGKIMLGIAEVARCAGHQVWTFSPDGRTQKRGIEGNYFIGSRYERAVSRKVNYYLGENGRCNVIGTKRLLQQLDEIRPDVIHFHNLHSDYLNLEMLIDYVKRNQIKVIYTLHDCWTFTGHCPYFDVVQCDKWKTQCHECPVIQEYPSTKWDTSAKEYRRKKKLFTSIPNMVIVTPSKWLADLVSDSFLKNYPVRVIYNGINLSTFSLQPGDCREKYGIGKDKFMILGIAFSWGFRKGLDRFERLASLLDDRFQIVLIGIEQAQVKSSNIICIPRTENQKQLAQIYSVADVLLNPTREDNFPTVNVEALACGLPVLSYGAGGSAEAFDRESGRIVNDENVVQVLNNLYDSPFDREKCIERGKEFDQNVKFEEYVKLYEEIIGEPLGE